MQFTSENGPAFRRVFAFAFAAVLVAAPLAMVPAALGQGNASTEQTRQYVVGPNDILAISVVDQAALTSKYIVREDGTFTFPLIGRIQAGGLTLQAVEDTLRDKLAKGYLKDPQVAVSVDQFRSQQVFVMGEVKNPGPMQFTGSMTVLEALARSGSTTERASMEAIIIRQGGASGPQLDPAALERARNSASSENTIHVDLSSLQTGGLSQNITLRSGDTLFVPRAESVFVSGQVARAGEYVIRKGMTVRQVLALAGGVTERGSTGRIQIIRQVDGKDSTIGASLQDAVRPGDTVVVRERLF